MNHLVIVGGGTAGWMAAIAFSSRFPEKQITVIDADAIGAIGVGESVTGVVLQFVQDPRHGLSLGEFFRRCDATFKAGIWYRDWQGIGTEYLSPIDVPPEHFPYYYGTNAEEFYAAAAADGARLADVHLYGHLMRLGKTDHARQPNGTINIKQAQVSCHFDALKFAAWLREKATQRPNVRHINDVVQSFTRLPDSGRIRAVVTSQQPEIEGDFFLDCSGFHRLLLAKAFDPPWKSYRDVVRVDAAIPCFQDYQPGQAPPTYTLASALPHGWLWQIPTQSRLGRGYLFASRYIEVEQAIAEMRQAGVDPGDNPRVLRFNPGRFERQWIENVCAIGLSGGFIEPLESSTIHGMFVQITLLSDLYLPYLTSESMPVFAQQYNRLIAEAYEDYLDFITFHYLTGRADSEFWRDYQQPSSMTSRNAERWEKWKHAFPTREDFAPTFTQRAGHTTGLAIWAPMLCGLGVFNREAARHVVRSSAHYALLQQNIGRYLQFRNQTLATATTQLEAIQHLRALPSG